MRSVSSALRRLAAVTLLAALPAAGAGASALADAVARYEAGDHAAAQRLLAPLARAGQPRAQYYLGLVHLSGQGAARDGAAAAWLEKAAAGGVADAASTLGRMYAAGLGVPMDAAQAVRWFERAEALARQARPGKAPYDEDC